MRQRFPPVIQNLRGGGSDSRSTKEQPKSATWDPVSKKINNQKWKVTIIRWSDKGCKIEGLFWSVRWYLKKGTYLKEQGSARQNVAQIGAWRGSIATGRSYGGWEEWLWRPLVIVLGKQISSRSSLALLWVQNHPGQHKTLSPKNKKIKCWSMIALG